MSEQKTQKPSDGTLVFTTGGAEKTVAENIAWPEVGLGKAPPPHAESSWMPRTLQGAFL